MEASQPQANDPLLWSAKGGRSSLGVLIKETRLCITPPGHQWCYTDRTVREGGKETLGMVVCKQGSKNPRNARTCGQSELKRMEKP